MDRKVLDAEAFIEIRYAFCYCIDDVGNFVADDEFNVLFRSIFTLAANWSPIKSPSLILMGPSKNSTVVCASLKLWFPGLILFFKNNNYLSGTFLQPFSLIVQ